MVPVSFDNVRKTYGKTVAIPGLDLAIAAGEFVSLLGPSGCGKSTTLRMLAGLETPSSGRILIGDRVVNEIPPAQRDIAMVFQSYALYPHMTVAENIAYPLRKRGLKPAQRAPLIAEVAALLQLESLLERKPRQLSGGQQQRVALGRALVRNPQVFLLDEPLSNLDAKLRAHMRAELIELHRRLGKTMVYVTHDQLEAMTMSTRIAVMRGGTLQQFATPDEIYRQPANSFVAGFIGTPSMTLSDGELLDCSALARGRLDRDGLAHRGAVLRFGSVELALPDGFLREAAPCAVSIGVRPEDVRIGDGPFSASVRVFEPTGHECIATLDADGITLTARLPGDARLEIGTRVPFALRAERIHVFDRQSGARLNSDRAVAVAAPPAMLLRS
jgi:multiple sugar transport system ATP-binding protein